MIWHVPKRHLFWIYGRVAPLAVGLCLRFIADTTASAAEVDSLAGKPVVGKNADGVLEVFEVDARGELRHRWQKKSNGDWSSWSSLGTGFFPGLAVADDAAGRMDVFAVDRTNQTLECIQQRATNSLDWSDWTNLGGAIRPPVAVGPDKDGRLEVFAVDATSGAVKHIWQTNVDGQWSSWSNLGGAVRPWLVAAANKDGRLELFGISSNDTLVHCWQQQPGASSNWSEWSDLGGSILPGFAVGRNVAGLLEVFAVNRINAAVNRICQASPSDSRKWTQWLDFGADVKPGLAAEKNAVGRLEIFAVDARNGTLMHRWETLNNGADIWSPWTDFGQASRTFPALGENEDGVLEVFAVDATNGRVIFHRRQITSASGWLDWSTLDDRALQYNSRAWQIGDGFPENSVQAIAQTRDGYLWVGTREGLARFDGVQFIMFDAKNTPALENSSITALCTDRDGTLWIGTDGGGLVRMQNGVFTHYGQRDGLSGNKVRALCEAKNGSLWIGTETGMSRYQDGKFTNYTKSNGLLSDFIRYIFKDSDGNLWIATGNGLNCLKVGGVMDSFTMPDGLPNDSVRAICQDKGGQIWVGSNNGLLWHDSFWWQSFYAYNTRYGLSDTFVSAVCDDGEGNLWVGTYSGLNRFRQGRFFSQLDSEGLPFDKVTALFADRQGNLWVGTQEGLVRLTPKRFTAYNRQQGLADNNIMSVLQDRNGNFWIGTWGGGLNEMTGEKVTTYAPTNSLSRDLILSLCEGHDGSIWAGADFDGGLTQLKDGKATHYTWKDGLPNAGLRILHEDRAGNLWIGTSLGLSCLRNGKFINYTVKDHLAGNTVNAICEDHAGNLWFGTDGGLSCWKDGRFINFTTNDGLSDNSVHALHEDVDGDLWIGTETGGLDRFRNGRFTVCTTRDGLFSDEIFSILEDDEGWFWMSCSKGVFRVRKADLDAFAEGKIKMLTSIAYDKVDGMESSQCNGAGKPAGWKDRDGRLWFPTSKGLVTVDPATMPADQTPPPVQIEQVIVDRKPIIPDARELAMDATAGGTGVSLSIPPARGELQFQYAALNLSVPEKSRFKYKLDGIDSDWVDAETRRTAYYNNIPPGRYRFHVIACNKDGVWNKSGATLAFVLLPYYWQTWWFHTLLALLVVGSASGSALYLTRRKMQRKLQLLEQRNAIERERGRIAKDIHDDLGSSLTRIMMLGERAEEGLAKSENVGLQVQKIVSSARHTVQSLDEIVWAVNPENDTLEGLVGYISHYADEFFENTTVRCRLEMPVESPHFTLATEIRHNLFLVVKETFHNVLKHSHASEVRVQILLGNNSTVDVVIEDNGHGLNLNGDGAGRKGNGLENMRKRMAELNGQFHITSTPGQGTRLQFTVNLDAPHQRP